MVYSARRRFSESRVGLIYDRGIAGSGAGRNERPMVTAFDPYHVWLGIAPKDQPANLYRLLGIDLFESNSRVIESAAAQRMLHLRTFHLGPYSELSQQILNEVAAARSCLLAPDRKAAYDAELSASQRATISLGDNPLLEAWGSSAIDFPAVPPPLPGISTPPRISGAPSAPTGAAGAAAWHESSASDAAGDGGPEIPTVNPRIKAGLAAGGVGALTLVIVVLAGILWAPSDSATVPLAETQPPVTSATDGIDKPDAPAHARRPALHPTVADLQLDPSVTEASSSPATPVAASTEVAGTVAATEPGVAQSQPEQPSPEIPLPSEPASTVEPTAGAPSAEKMNDDNADVGPDDDLNNGNHAFNALPFGGVALLESAVNVTLDQIKSLYNQKSLIYFRSPIPDQPTGVFQLAINGNSDGPASS